MLLDLHTGFSGIPISLRIFHSLKASVAQHSTFFMVHLLHFYMTTGKNIDLSIWIFLGKMISLLLNVLSRFVIAFLPKSKHLLMSWLQSLSLVILEPKKTKPITFHFFPIYLPWSNGTRCRDLGFFECWVLSQLFHSPLSTSTGCLISLHFMPFGWYHLHIWCYWYSS